MSIPRFLFLLALGVFGHAGFSRAVVLNPEGLDGPKEKYSCEDLVRGKVRLIVENGACVGFDGVGEQSALHVLFDTPVSGVVLASRDGRTIVAIQSELSGKVDAGGIFQPAEGSSEHDPFVVLIYRDGKPTGAYRLTEILRRPRMVSTGEFCSLYRHHKPCTSRVNWLRYYAVRDSQGGQELVLETTSMREVSLDLNSGAKTRDEDALQWKSCDLVAQGAIARLGDRAEMGPIYLLKGHLHRPLAFTVAPGVDIRGDGQIQVVCFRQTPGGYAAVSVFPMWLDQFDADRYEPPFAMVPQEKSAGIGFHADLLGMEEFMSSSPHVMIWKFSIEPDKPVQRMDVSISETGASRGVMYVPNEGYTVDINDVPDHATLLIDAITGNGDVQGPVIVPVDVTSMVRKLPGIWKARLQRHPHRWVEIRKGASANFYLYFRPVADGYCGLREIRYSVDSHKLDKRFAIPRCRVADKESYLLDLHEASLSRADYGRRDVPLPKKPKFVAVQLVYFDGSVSDVVVEGDEADVGSPALPQ